MTLPNFFIVGAGKSGTTSLHTYLRQHPQIYMSPVKEPAFFADEIRPEFLTDPIRRHVALQSRHLPKVLNDPTASTPYGWIAATWDDYLRLFREARDETAIGEATAAYLWSATAAANIHARIPAAKIIMILRDPAERAFSQYLHELTVGLSAATFRQQIERCDHPFLDVGLYHDQVSRFLDLFPRDQIRIYWYEESWRKPELFLADVFRFLGVDPTFHPDLSRKEHSRRAPRFVALHYFLKRSGLWNPLKSILPKALRPHVFREGKSLTIPPEDRRYLIDYYRPDILRLSSLLNRDLSSWLQ